MLNLWNSSFFFCILLTLLIIQSLYTQLLRIACNNLKMNYKILILYSYSFITW